MSSDPSTATHPVTLNVQRPTRYERAQLVLRVIVCATLGALHPPFGGLFMAIYLLLPSTAAILISHRGGPTFREQDAAWLTAVIEWIVGLYAYMMFVTDRFPLSQDTRPLRLQIIQCGRPTVSQALFRLVSSLPHLFLLAILGAVSVVVSLLMAIAVLFTTSVPASFGHFQRDVLGWLARLLAYHASLVDAYPPFGFDSTVRIDGSQQERASS